MERNNRNGEGKAWTLFIDLKSAFDNVNHEQMFEKMHDMGIDENLCNTIKWIYK